MYQFETDKFHGPLDLLLNLIEREKLDITEISLAKITDHFLAELSQLKLAEEEMAEFLLVASKLLYLKSKELLPSIENEEGEEEIEDLERSLIEYKKYREAAEKFKEILAEDKRAYNRRGREARQQHFLPPENLKITELYRIFASVMAKGREPEEGTVTAEVKYTIAEKTDLIRTRLASDKQVTLLGLIRGALDRMEKIVTFLALLEMIKKREVLIRQDNNFSDIIIRPMRIKA